jgi:hypothetical protein
MPSAKRSHAGALFDDMFDLEAQLSDSAVAIDDSPPPPKRQLSHFVYLFFLGVFQKKKKKNLYRASLEGFAPHLTVGPPGASNYGVVTD